MSFNLIDFLGIIAAVTSVVAFLPQIYKNHKTGSVADLSFLMLLNFFICSLSWTLYGSLIQSPYVFITNVACLFGSGYLIAQKVYFER